MRILLVNPNTTAYITDAFQASLPSYADVETITFTCPQAKGSVESIQSMTTSVKSAYHSIVALESSSYLTRDGGVDGILVCCYSNHPLIEMLRESFHGPVIGIMQASLYTGLQLGHKVGIVTTASKWGPLMENSIPQYHLAQESVLIRTTGLSVLDLHDKPVEQVHGLVVDKSKDLIEAGCDVISLGCAGMTGLEETVQNAVGDKIMVIDGVKCGFEMVCAIVRMKLGTTKGVLYA